MMLRTHSLSTKELEADLRAAFAKQGMELYKDDGVFVWRDDFTDSFLVYFGPPAKKWRPYHAGANWGPVADQTLKWTPGKI